MLHIGLDGIPLATPKTGIGHYTFELACCLAAAAPAREFELLSHAAFSDSAFDPTNKTLPANLRATRITGRMRRHWWAVGLPLYLKKSSISLFHGTNYDVPLWGGCRTVSTIHDLSLLLHADTHEKQLVRRARWRFPLMARRATMIITPSESVKREVCEHLSVAPDKIVAIPEAPRRVFRLMPAESTIETRRRLGVEDEFLLFVGTIEPRKNLSTLVRAFAEILRTTSLNPQLVIAGKQGWLTDELFSCIKDCGVGDRLRFTGYISDEDLRALYSSCRVCIYPSLYEGFGLPPLEAMACGAPVITSRIQSIIETVGTAARVVTPTSVHALAESIVELLGSEKARQRLAIEGMQRASTFSWEKTARLTLDVYDEARRRS